MRPSDQPNPQLAAEKAARDRKRSTGRHQSARSRVSLVCRDGSVRTEGQDAMLGLTAIAAEQCKMEVQRLAIVHSQAMGLAVTFARKRGDEFPRTAMDEEVTLKEGAALKQRHVKPFRAEDHYAPGYDCGLLCG